MVSAKDPTSIDTATQEAVEKLDESSSSTATSCKENISFTEDQVTLFQKRYDNGYNLYHDDIILYVAWLQQEHPESLPDDIVIPDTSPLSPVTENINTIVKSQNDSCTELQNLSENSDNFSVQESSDISDLDVQAPTKSLSVSLSQTRSLLSELSEFLNHPKEPVKAKGKKSAARVLTSAESLSLLIEKEKKKREEEEAKEKRKEERERKRKEKEAEKQRKAEMKKKKDENATKKPSKSKRSNAKKAPVSPDPPSDSESQRSADEEGIQSHEISSNECAVCFGLYQDDLSSTGKLLTEWVQCTNKSCMKWMHIQCIHLSEELYSCGVCGTQFS